MVTSRMFLGLFLVVNPFFFYCSYSSTFTITNNCPHTIWPGTLAGAGTPQLPTTGFQLDSGQSVRIPTTPGWSGRIWARTGCTFDDLGAGKCQTGDCGGRLECDGTGATPPTSLFEITLGAGNGLDFYDVSIVDGYNLPLVAAPDGVYGACNATGCVSDINNMGKSIIYYHSTGAQATPLNCNFEMKQVAQRSFRWWAAVKREEEEGWLRARVHVKHSG